MHPDELHRIKTDKQGNIKLDLDKIKIIIPGERSKTIKESKETAFYNTITQLRYYLTYIPKNIIITIEDSTGNKLTKTREELCNINNIYLNKTLSEYLREVSNHEKITSKN